MPTLPSIEFSHTGLAGDKLAFTAKVNVGNDGVFSVRLPDDIFDVSIREFDEVAMQGYTAARYPGVTHAVAQGAHRVYAPSLKQATAYIEGLLRHHLSATVVREDVLVYRYVSGVHYWKTADGTILPNGMGRDGDGTWHGARSLHANEVHPNYTVGFVAYALVRVTSTRGETVRTTFERWRGPEDDTRTQLNSFVRLDWSVISNDGAGRRGDGNLECSGFRTILYTPAAATFLLNTMLSLCRIDDHLSTFFADTAKVDRAIETGRQLQLA